MVSLLVYGFTFVYTGLWFHFCIHWFMVSLLYALVYSFTFVYTGFMVLFPLGRIQKLLAAYFINQNFKKVFVPFDTYPQWKDLSSMQ